MREAATVMLVRDAPGARGVHAAAQSRVRLRGSARTCFPAEPSIPTTAPSVTTAASGSRPCARRSRRPACCSPGRATTRSSMPRPTRWPRLADDRLRLLAGTAIVRRRPRRARGPGRSRRARPVRPLDHPGAVAPSVRHLVLRRGRPRRPRLRARRLRSRRLGVGPTDRRAGSCARRRHRAHLSDRAHVARDGAVLVGGRVPRRGTRTLGTPRPAARGRRRRRFRP